VLCHAVDTDDPETDLGQERRGGIEEPGHDGQVLRSDETKKLGFGEKNSNFWGALLLVLVDEILSTNWRGRGENSEGLLGEKPKTESVI